MQPHHTKGVTRHAGGVSRAQCGVRGVRGELLLGQRDFKELVNSEQLEAVWKENCVEDAILWEPYDDDLPARVMSKYKSTLHD